MNILAFDNSTSTCVVALKTKGQIHSLTKTAPMQQAKLILPMIDQLLTQAKLKLSELNYIAYGAGPGSFTGIRIASSVAQGLGFGANIPLVPLSSLALLAQSAALEKGVDDILVAIDARMGQIYFAHYMFKSHQLLPQCEEQLLSPTEVKTPTNHSYAIGDGWAAYKKLFSAVPEQIDNNLTITPDALITLAENAFLLDKTVLAGAAIPVYLR